MIAAQRAALLRNLHELAIELALLRAKETDVARKKPPITPVGDHDLGLTLLVLAQAADDTKLEQQQLDIPSELRAVGRVRDLDCLARQQRRGAIPGEQRLEKYSLERLRAPPHELGDHLFGATFFGPPGKGRAGAVESARRTSWAFATKTAGVIGPGGLPKAPAAARNSLRCCSLSCHASRITSHFDLSKPGTARSMVHGLTVKASSRSGGAGVGRACGKRRNRRTGVPTIPACPFKAIASRL